MLGERDFALFGVRDGRYIPCTEVAGINPGQGYWVHLPAGTSALSGTPVSAAGGFTIPVSPGWNLIGNPFLSEIDLVQSASVGGVSLENADGVSAVVFGYDAAEKRYAATTVLKPWEGYFLYSRVAAVLELSPPTDSGTPEPAAPQVVTIRIESAPDGTGREVGPLDLLPGEEVTFWAAGYDKAGGYLGGVEAQWAAEGTLGALSAASGVSVSYRADSGGRAGTVAAAYGQAADSTGRVVVVDDSPLSAYPFGEEDPVARDDAGVPYISDQLLVAVAPGTADARVEELAGGIGAKVVGRNSAAGVYQFKLESTTPQDAAAALDGLPEIRTASPNYLLAPSAVPADPVFDAAAPYIERWGFEKVGMTSVWKEYAPVGDPVIAVLDTGVDASHPELAGRVSGGVNLISPAAGTGDVYGHGTPIAGVAAAKGDNAAGIAGMCWNCRIMPVKVCTDAGTCPLFTVLDGITYAVNNGARIVNISVGADFPSGSPVEQIVRAITRDAYYRGALVVAAAGNGGHDSGTFLPGADRYVMSAGASDEDDQRASFSNYGTRVDVAAPGKQVYTTGAGGGYVYRSGTSFSAAFVSGLAGIVLSIHPDMSVNTLKSYISSNVDVISTDRPIGGRINAGKVLQSLMSSNLPPVISSLVAERLLVRTGETVQLTLAAGDPDGDPLNVEWNPTAGTVAPAGAWSPAWQAPASRGEIVIAVTVRDTQGAVDAAEIRIAVLDGAAAEVRIEPDSPTVGQGGTVALSAYAYDAPALGGTASPVRVYPVWSVTGGVGTVSADGVFAATNAGTGMVTAAIDGLTGTTSVTVTPGTSPSLTPAATNVPCGNDWPMMGCNLSRNDQSSLELPGPMTVRQVFSTVANMMAGPLMVNGRAYAVDLGGNLYCIDQNTWTQIWTVPLAGGIPYRSPVAANGAVYVLNNGGILYKRNLDGTPVWQYSPASGYGVGYSTLAATSDSVYYVSYNFSGLDGEVIALNDADGSEKWPPLNILYPSQYVSIAVETVGATEMLFVGKRRHDIDKLRYMAVNASTGAIVWEQEVVIIGGSSFRGSPVVEGNALYALEESGNIVKFDATTGSVIWVHDLGQWVYGDMAYRDSVLYVGTIDGYVHAILDSGLTSSELWVSEKFGGVAGAEFFGAPAITGSYVIAGGVGAGAPGTFKILNRADGSTYQTILFSCNYSDSPAVGFYPTSGETEIYMTCDGPKYVIAFERNYPPNIISLSYTPPGQVVPGGSTDVFVQVEDPNQSGGTPCSDIFAVEIDLGLVGGATATLLDDGFPPDAAADDCLFTATITVEPGTSAGLKPLLVTAYDYGNFTDATDTPNLEVLQSAPTVVSVTFTPPDVVNNGADTTQVSVVVEDLNDSINAVMVDLDEINGASGTEWLDITAGCGAFSTTTHQVTCTFAGITADPSTTLGFKTIPGRAIDDLYDVSGSPTPNNLEVIDLGSFRVTASPTSLPVNTDTTITIEAYDDNGSLIDTYVNAVAIDLSQTGAATGTTLTWSGAGVTNNGDGTGFIATGTFVAGVATVKLKNIRANETITAAATNPSDGSTGNTSLTGTNVTWTPGPLAKFVVTANPTTPVIGTAATVSIKAYDAYDNFIGTYENDDGPIDLQAELAGFPCPSATMWWTAVAPATITDLGGGCATLEMNSFGGDGEALVNIYNTTAEGPAKITAAHSLSGATGNTNETGTDVTWGTGVLDHFDVYANPYASVPAGATTTVYVEAHDAFHNVITTFDKDMNITQTGGTASAITYSGANIVDLGGGNGKILGAAFVSGLAEFYPADTKATETVRFTATEPTSGASGNTGAGENPPTNTDVTWVPGALAKYIIRDSPNGGGSEQGNKIMAAGASLTLYAAGYDQYDNLRGDDPACWSVTGTLDPIATGPFSVNTFIPAHEGPEGTIHVDAPAAPGDCSAFDPGVVTDDTGTIKVGSDKPLPPTLTAVGGTLEIRLSWSGPFQYEDGTSVTPGELATFTFNVYRSLSASGVCDPGNLYVTGVGPATSTYTDTAVTSWVTYYYVVTAVNPNALPTPEESECSNVASAVAMEPAWTLLRKCGENPTEYLPPWHTDRFNRPMDAVVDPAGFIYVADMDNHRIKKIDMNCVYITHWGTLGPEDGNFRQPMGIAYSGGELYVVDNYNRVQVFDTNGVFLRKWDVSAPVAIEAAAGALFVTTSNWKIKKYDSVGTLLDTFTLKDPKGIAADASGNLYVATWDDSTIRKLDSSGAAVATYGAFGSAYGQTRYPFDVDLDSAGNMIIADGTYNNRVQIWKPDGSIDNVIHPKSNDYATLNGPMGVAVASTGELVVMDTDNSRVLIFQPPP
ncbi:MAG: S8 family serine peptidase [bacterium]